MVKPLNWIWDAFVQPELDTLEATGKLSPEQSAALALWIMAFLLADIRDAITDASMQNNQPPTSPTTKTH